MAHIPSEKAKRISDRIKAGRPIQYDVDTHLPLLLDIFSEGNDIAAFCAEAEICRDTFHSWIKTYPEFSDTYGVAREIARSWYEERGKYGIQNKDFNFQVWALIMRNRNGYTSERKVKIDGLDQAKTHNEMATIVFKAIGEGVYTLSEIKNLMSSIADSALIDEKTNQAKAIEELEKRAAKK